MTLPVGQVVQVAVQYTSAQGGIRFQLCSASSCSVLLVDSRNSENALGYRVFACNARARPIGDCTQQGGQVRLFADNDGLPTSVLCSAKVSLVAQVSPANSVSLSSGQLVFIVEKRPSALVVWLRGYPKGAAVLAAREELALLGVRPQAWVSDLLASFGCKCSAFKEYDVTFDPECEKCLLVCLNILYNTRLNRICRSHACNSVGSTYAMFIL